MLKINTPISNLEIKGRIDNSLPQTFSRSKHIRENKAAAYGGIKEKTAMMEHWRNLKYLKE